MFRGACLKSQLKSNLKNDFCIIEMFSECEIVISCLQLNNSISLEIFADIFSDFFLNVLTKTFSIIFDHCVV